MCGAGPGDLRASQGSASAENPRRTEPKISSQTAFRYPRSYLSLSVSRMQSRVALVVKAGGLCGGSSKESIGEGEGGNWPKIYRFVAPKHPEAAQSHKMIDFCLFIPPAPFSYRPLREPAAPPVSFASLVWRWRSDGRPWPGARAFASTSMQHVVFGVSQVSG